MSLTLPVLEPWFADFCLLEAPAAAEVQETVTPRRRPWVADNDSPSKLVSYGGVHGCAEALSRWHGGCLDSSITA
jgi:hypothetical protein